ncbi:MAG TPA: response regulator, partial [Dehalococcoidia bacterium]|nr:response regulator [Dehalococcoidia bacterium]
MSRILVADNDLGIGHAIDRHLRQEGYVISVVTMHGALSAIDRCCPDLIVVDLPLAKDGIDLCRLIRARTRAPIFVIAPKVPGVCDLLDREVSVDDYLIKPLRPQELTNRVEALL